MPTNAKGALYALEIGKQMLAFTAFYTINKSIVSTVAGYENLDSDSQKEKEKSKKEQEEMQKLKQTYKDSLDEDIETIDKEKSYHFFGSGSKSKHK